MTNQEILAKVASGAMTIEEATKAMAQNQVKGGGTLHCKVSEKGAISVYGLQRMPVTLYVGQWERLIAFVPELQKFAKEHDKELSRK